MLILGWLSVWTGVAQELPLIQVDHYGIEEGLSHRYVSSIVQDDQGFLWLGTHYGLNRFDGYSFTWFTEETDHLQSNHIDYMFKDQQGQIWLINTGSNYSWGVKTIDIFDPTTESVISLEEKLGEEGGFSAKEVQSIAQHKDGSLLIFTGEEFITYTDHFTYFPFEGYDPEKGYSVFWADNGHMWLSAHNSINETHTLIQFDPDGNLLSETLFEQSIIFFIYDSDNQGKVYASVFYWSEDETKWDQRYVAVDQNGEYTADPGLGKILADHGQMQGFKGSLLSVIDHNIWTLTETDEFLVTPIDQSHAPIDLTARYPYLKNANDVFEDQQGAVWVGCQFGVFRMKLSEPLFKKYLRTDPEDPENSQRSIRGITVTQQDSNQVLWGIVEQAGEIWKVDLNRGTEEMHNKFGDYRWVVAKNANNDIYYRGEDGLIKTNGMTAEDLDLLPFAYHNDHWGLTFLHEDQNGRIWFNNIGDGALLYFDGKKQTTFSNWVNPSDNIYFYQILETGSDSAWLVSSQGLFSFDLKTGKLLNRYYSKGEGSKRLPYDNIHHMVRNEDSTYWLATAGTGLVNWSPEKGVIRRYTRVDGLSNNTIYAVYPDDYGNLWLPTDLGICKLNLASGQVRTYTTIDGLNDNEFNRTSHFSAEDGTLFFGSLNGVTSFHPEDFVLDSSLMTPPLVLTSFQQLDGKSGILIDRTNDLKATNQITMQPDDPLIRISFSLLSYQEMGNIQYAYKIEGIDQDWNYQSENTLRLGRLPYGTHFLHIRAQGSNGRWSDQELHFTLISVRPLYLRPWFIIIVVVALFAAIYLIYRRREQILIARQEKLEEIVLQRTATIEEQKEELKSLDKLKTRFFANVSHELRTPLTLILGPLESLVNNSDNRSKKEQSFLQHMQRNSRKLLKLVNEILDLSKLESGNIVLKEQPVLLHSFLQPTVAQFSSFSDSKGIIFVTDLQIPSSLKVLLDGEKVESILQNYLSNAFKYTPSGGVVTLAVSEKEADLLIRVTDTGTGIPASELPHVFDRFYQTQSSGYAPQGGTGIGLSLVWEFAQLMGGKAWAESNPGDGSSFYVSLPKQIVSSDVTAVPEETELISAAPLELPSRQVSASDEEYHILVVEDSQDLRSYLQSILDESYRVTTVENGKEGWDFLMENKASGGDLPNLIISDLMMPLMDGHELLSRSKMDPLISTIPFIMLTARADIGSKLEALRIGVDDYLTKPFLEAELLARASNLLANYQKRKSESQRIEFELPEGTAPREQSWLKRFEKYVQTHISSGQLTVTNLADEFAMSESTLLRQLKRLTGLSPKQYLQEIRLNLAWKLLEQEVFASVSEVASHVGYTRVQSFSRSFKERFGKSPSELIPH